MSNPVELLSTIDDYLLSIADGIALAQQHLAASAASGPPGRQFTYYLPKVDFELRMTVRVVESTDLTAKYQKVRGARANDQHLVFAPVSPEAQATMGLTAEIVSVVSGSFVAVPANEGLPAVRLATSIDATDPRAVLVTVRARNASNEPVRDLEVHVNLDREESALLDPTHPLGAGTGLAAPLVRTGPDGVASTVLTIDATQAPHSLLALVIDAAGRTEMVVYEVPA